MPTQMLTKRHSDLERGKSLREYENLKKAVHEELILGRARVEHELNRMRYNTGCLINEHVRLNEDRAAYGEQSIPKLGKDFEIDPSELQRYAKFSRSYPIVGGRPQLNFNLPWAHYRKLMIVKDDDKRWSLTLQAEKSGWSFEEIESRVRVLIPKAKTKKSSERLPFVCLGPLFTYRIVRPVSLHSGVKELLVDFGFKQRLEISFLKQKPFPEETIVTAREGSLELAPLKNAAEEMLYTYKARVEKILDGDTLQVEFLFGLGSRRSETIRLNHVDCPELDTPEGKTAKRFVESEFKDVPFITLKSVKTRQEKWGRYLADVFYSKKDSPRLIYLNQLLLDKGHAVRLKM